MSEPREVQISEVRIGDLIRVSDNGDPDWVLQYRVKSPSMLYETPDPRFKYYLLDRPGTEIPTVPTLGWITTNYAFDNFRVKAPTLAFVGSWVQQGNDNMVGGSKSGYRRLNGAYGQRDRIVEFIEAVPVPKDALEDFRDTEADLLLRYNNDYDRAILRRDAISTFLNKVNEANNSE